MSKLDDGQREIRENYKWLFGILLRGNVGGIVVGLGLLGASGVDPTIARFLPLPLGTFGAGAVFAVLGQLADLAFLQRVVGRSKEGWPDPWTDTTGWYGIRRSAAWLSAMMLASGSIVLVGDIHHLGTSAASG